LQVLDILPCRGTGGSSTRRACPRSATHTSSARRGSGGTDSARRNTICSFQTSPTERSSLPSSSLLVDRTVTSSKIGRGSGQNASEATAPLLQGASPIAGDGHFVSSSSFLTILPLFMMILRFFSSCSTDMTSRGVALNHEQVRELALLYGADLIFHPEELGVGAGGRDEALHRAHDFDLNLKLPCLTLVQGTE
jgi:hypothetical protein